MPEDFEIRTRIVKAALELFVKFGYSKVTMDEIAENLGMSKKTLYQYFPSKQELIQGIIQSAMHECDTFCDRIIGDQTMRFEDKLRQMPTYFLRVNGNLSRELVADLRKHLPDMWQQIHEWRHTRIAAQFGLVLREGISKGSIRNDIDEKLIIMMYLGIIENMMNPQVIMQLSQSAPQIFESIWKVFFEGILTADARKTFSVSATVALPTITPQGV
ncbi:TetR/AcrR family transcriptional regulator [bacterium]|nr:TetR/AcrR family transcriptional regulator [bacterium]NUN44928.1 TetR/AcrR family transcriptional regulator [bacterium]